jgi:cobalt/nickel transport protein
MASAAVSRPAATVLVLTIVLLLAAGSASAHFGMVIPEHSIVPMEDKSLGLQLSFSHPMEMVGMEMVKPKSFKVYHNGQATELASSLTETTVMDHKAWECDYTVGRPGMYAFAVEPQPYPEPAEDNYIIHYTKTMVSGFDAGEGWEQPLGLKTEIVPLTRPWGNYAGNVLAGQVLLDGKPVPGALVEVEYYNREGEYLPPSDAFITQEVVADENGVFAYACPWAGWWGFAALSEADYQIEGKAVELGAVLWVEMVDAERK